MEAGGCLQQQILQLNASRFEEMASPITTELVSLGGKDYGYTLLLILQQLLKWLFR
jgi:hypothetical protein